MSPLKHKKLSLRPPVQFSVPPIEPSGEELTNIELTLLCYLCSKIQPKNVLEIGTRRGRETIAIAMNLPDGARVWTIGWGGMNEGELLDSIPQSAGAAEIIELKNFTAKDHLKKYDMIYGSYKLVPAEAMRFLTDDGVLICRDIVETTYSGIIVGGTTLAVLANSDTLEYLCSRT